MTMHSSFLGSRALTLALTLAFAVGPGVLWSTQAVAASPRKAGASRAANVTVNFVNAEIDGVARAMSAIIDRQIMVDPRVKGQITLYSEQPVTAREAYQNFLSALRGQGFALVEVAGMLKVVPEAEAKLQTGTVDVGNRPSRSGDQILTQIFRLQHESANALVAVLRPLISPNNTINANPATNTLVITDYADNLQRIGQIIAAMDLPSSTDMEAITLQHAMASDLVPVIQRFADGGGAAGVPGAAAAGGGGVVVMADARTNTLLVKAANPVKLAQLRGLAQRLDRPGSNGLGGSGINVVYLKNADAVKLAAVLRAAYPISGASGGGGGASGGSPSPAPTQAAAAQGGGSTGASPQATAPVAASAQPSTGGYIQADPSTNSLIITAPDAVYRQLRTVIDQLDSRRAQIYIEAMIVKVDASKISSLGVQWAGATGDRTIVGAGTSLAAGRIPSLTSVIQSVAGGAVPALGGLNVALARKLSDGTISLGALATFLQTEAGGNVLSTPNLITLDNEEAKIVVGSNVPFVTGSFSNTGANNGSVNPFQTIERKDVGLTLRVRPQVGEGGTVRMTIFQEDAAIAAETATNQNGPTTSKSSIETTVVIDDGQVLVLGGLMKDEYGDGQTKVPLLGDIPGVGNLFKAQERSRKKSNLMVFLRPVVMRTQEASNAITLDRYDYMRQRQVETTPASNPVMGINEVPVLEPLRLSNGLSMPGRPVATPLPGTGAPAAVPAPPVEPVR